MPEKSPNLKKEKNNSKKYTQKNLFIDKESLGKNSFLLINNLDLKKTLNNLPNHIFRIKKDNDGNLIPLLSEGEAAEKFNLNTEKIKGKTLKEVFSRKETYSRLKSYWEKAFSGEKTDFEIELGDKWYKTIIKPFKKTQNGNVTEVIGFTEDISKRKKAEEKLKKYCGVRILFRLFISFIFSTP